MNENISHIGDEGIRALGELIGCYIARVQAPKTSTNLRGDDDSFPPGLGCGFVSASNFFIAMLRLEDFKKSDPQELSSVVFSVNSVMTDLGELHEIVIDRPDTARVVSTSDVVVEIGVVQSIEILEARAFSAWTDNVGNDRTADIHFDRAINFKGAQGSFSLMTEFGEIVDDLKIRPITIPAIAGETVDGVLHSLSVRLELTSQ